MILSERMEGVRSVAVGIWLRQGSVHERPEERGISHLLEHMVFKGTERRSARDLVLAVERIGGALDAYTGHEWTAYQARVPDRHLHGALDVLADLVFHPTLRGADLELERQVVLEELAGIEDAPEELAFELHASELYGDHPYGARVAGSPRSVASVGPGALRDLHASAYRAGNAIVVAAGRLEHDELVRSVARLLPEDRLPGRPAVSAVPTLRPGRHRLEREGGRQSHLVAGSLAVPHGNPLRYAVVLVETALGAGMSSRLFQRLREKRGLAYAVYSFASFYTAGGHVGAYLGTSPARAAEAREALLEELERLAVRGLGRDEIRTTKEQLQGQVLLSLEAPAARMSRLAGIALHGEPYRTLDQVAARIEAVSEQEAAQAASLLHPDRLTVVELVPAGTGTAPGSRGVGEGASGTEPRSDG